MIQNQQNVVETLAKGMLETWRERMVESLTQVAIDAIKPAIIASAQKTVDELELDAKSALSHDPNYYGQQILVSLLLKSPDGVERIKDFKR